MSTVVTKDKAAEAKAADRELETKMRNVLTGMVGRLKEQIDSTEKVSARSFHCRLYNVHNNLTCAQALGDKMRLLDLDGDGELSAEEIKAAMGRILKRSCSQEEVEEFIRILDEDKDGKVSVTELIRFAEQLRMKE